VVTVGLTTPRYCVASSKLPFFSPTAQLRFLSNAVVENNRRKKMKPLWVGYGAKQDAMRSGEQEYQNAGKQKRVDISGNGERLTTM